jgi:hypothetical protein
MSTVWDRLAVWLEDVEAPNRAQTLPLRGGDVELVAEQFDALHRGDPLIESASVQPGLLGGFPVADSKPPSWSSSAAPAGAARNGATTSADATSTVLHAADSRLSADMEFVPRVDRSQMKWPSTAPAETVYQCLASRGVVP